MQRLISYLHHQQRHNFTVFYLLVVPSIFLITFYVIPLCMMIVFSWLTAGTYGGVIWEFQIENFSKVLGLKDFALDGFNPVYLEVLWRSIKLAIITVLMCIVICYPLAFYISKRSPVTKNILVFLVVLPFFISQIVRLFAWILLLRSTGIVNQLLQFFGLISQPLSFLYTDGAVIIGMVYIFLPFMFLPLYASVENLDHNLIAAAQDLGAGPVSTFLRVTFPLTVPGIFGGSVIVFIPSVGNFIAPEVLGGAKVLMVGNLIEQQFLISRNWPLGAALGMMVIVSSILIIGLVALLARRKGMLGGNGASVSAMQ